MVPRKFALIGPPSDFHSRVSRRRGLRAVEGAHAKVDPFEEDLDSVGVEHRSVDGRPARAGVAPRLVGVGGLGLQLDLDLGSESPAIHARVSVLGDLIGLMVLIAGTLNVAVVARTHLGIGCVVGDQYHAGAALGVIEVELAGELGGRAEPGCGPGELGGLDGTAVGEPIAADVVATLVDEDVVDVRKRIGRHGRQVYGQGTWSRKEAQRARQQSQKARVRP